MRPETINLLGSIIKKVTKGENDKNVPHLEITKIVLVYCNISMTDYEHDSRVFYTFVPSKSFKKMNSEFPFIEVWSPDKNSKLLEIINLIIN